MLSSQEERKMKLKDGNDDSGSGVTNCLSLLLLLLLCCWWTKKTKIAQRDSVESYFSDHSKPNSEKEHSDLHVDSVLFEENIVNRIGKEEIVKVCELKRHDETRKSKQTTILPPSQFLIAITTNVLQSIKYLSPTPTSIHIELMVRTMKAMKSFDYGANEETKISSLRGSVIKWHGKLPI